MKNVAVLYNLDKDVIIGYDGVYCYILLSDNYCFIIDCC